MKIVIYLFLLNFSLLSHAADFDGVYVGEVINNGGEQVPLMVQLNLAEDVSQSNRVYSSRLEGSFLIGDEGGPYAFSNIDLNIDNDEFVMNYARSQNSTLPGDSMDMRFVGKLNIDGSISGKVLSGRNGTVGKFSIRKSDKRFKRKESIVGAWSGSRILNSGDSTDMELKIESSPSHSTNPSSFDLEYSHGKIGYVSFKPGIRYALTNVYLDYLNNKITMIHVSSNSSLVLKATITSSGDLVDGTIESTFGGLVGTFDLNK